MNSKLVLGSGAAVALGLVALLPLSAIAQTDWLTQARSYLEQEAQDFLPDHVSVQQPMTGSLNTGAEQYRNVRLQAGFEYAFLGACDDDCSDLDLYLYDARGRTLLDADTDIDDFPMVTFIPDRTANYRIKARMESCFSEPCYYALGIYRR